MNSKDNIIGIINEEIDRWFDDDESSLLDKYYEKKFGIVKEPPQKEIDVNPNDISKGELIGFLDKSWETKLDNPIPVYKNPISLDSFDHSARGVLLENGDFFLGKSSEAMHLNILQLLVKLGYLGSNVPLTGYEQKKPKEYVAVGRIGRSDIFKESGVFDEFPEYYQVMFDNANKKHKYKFRNFSVKK